MIIVPSELHPDEREIAGVTLAAAATNGDLRRLLSTSEMAAAWRKENCLQVAGDAEEAAGVKLPRLVRRGGCCRDRWLAGVAGTRRRPAERKEGGERRSKGFLVRGSRKLQ